MTQADFERVAHSLIGPEAPYSKIGRIRRENLRAAIVKELKKAYESAILSISPPSTLIRYHEDRLVVLTPDEDEDFVFNAVVPSLPGCLTFGTGEVESMERIKEAIECYLEAQ